MRTISACIFIFLSISGICQETYYDYVPLGSYHVGFCDNIIYNQEIQYKQYGYEGNQPVFLQIWFPTAIDSDQDLMKFDDFRDRQVPEALESVYQELLKHMDESFIRDGITYHLETDNPIDYGTKSYSDILELVKSQQTKSLRSALPVDADYPVIVYHHGSQGMSDENSIMAEYFASRGYIFISANFHMPYPNTPFGLLPYELEKENKHDQSTAKKVLQYAKSITSSNRLFFIGHSWGAQEGWCFLHEEDLADGFISMETTIEFKTDLTEIQEKWPYVYDAIKIKKNKFTIPLLLFAAKEKETNFNFFRSVGTAKTFYASYLKPFTHNSYTSFYMSRYFSPKEVENPDSEVLLSQIKGYSEHLNLMFDFLETIRTNTELNMENYDAFQIEQED